MVSAIFASKLYQVSNRKDRIHSAYMNPLNAELVQQIDSYVSPKYQKMLLEEDAEQAANTSEVEDGAAVSTPSGGSSGGSSFSGGGGGSFSGSDEDLPEMVTDEPGSDESGSDSTGTDTDASEPDASEPVSDDSVEQSTVIASSYTEKDAALEVETIKGSLNVKEETAGVSRIRVKDKELWIYYQDTVNLNNVMSSVIETMNALGYTYLEFSRLARSDNAIVFDIYESAQPIQPIEEDEEDGKEKEA